MPSGGRTERGCLCCACDSLSIETTIVSPFVAYRAWNGPPELTSIAFCGRCGFRFFARGLSNEESARYYRNYRDEEYFRDRNRFEPFYTRAAHRRIATWLASEQRRSALRRALDNAHAPCRFAAVLDYGGGNGQLLSEIEAVRKAVFDPSGSATIPGIEPISDESALRREWQLVICCQVLEHIHDPVAMLRRLDLALTPGGWLYVEVPNEIWRNHSGHGGFRDICLDWLLTRPRLLTAADLLSTACRIKLGMLPPLGFVPMREHINYFTAEALVALLRNCGFSIATSGTNSTGQIYAIARKCNVSTGSVGETEAAPA